MKRALAIVLAAVLLFSAIPMASAGNMKNFTKSKVTFRYGQFADIADTAWFIPGVRSAYEMGLMKGVTDRVFKPTGNLTVAEALAIACRIFSIYTGENTPFSQKTPWYQVYVDYAVEKGIMKEVDGTVDMNDVFKVIVDILGE